MTRNHSRRVSWDITAAQEPQAQESPVRPAFQTPFASPFAAAAQEVESDDEASEHSFG